ncbi:hypothetical protein GGX14DRAFT_390118 [Mycena pura]|uniref:F-box domain-containing protein n=1 Tax=Mycena pura TaxID=153505 RepID=A0AAD6VVT2_9AGAR|nr:hypothetical protein GGX14DRAFT_390118 [Mycena pura]
MAAPYVPQSAVNTFPRALAFRVLASCSPGAVRALPAPPSERAPHPLVHAYGAAAGCLPSALRCHRRRHICRLRMRAPQRRRVLHSRAQYSAVYSRGNFTAQLRFLCGQTRLRALMAGITVPPIMPFFRRASCTAATRLPVRYLTICVTSPRSCILRDEVQGVPFDESMGPTQGRDWDGREFWARECVLETHRLVTRQDYVKYAAGLRLEVEDDSTIGLKDGSVGFDNLFAIQTRCRPAGTATHIFGDTVIEGRVKFVVERGILGALLHRLVALVPDDNGGSGTKGSRRRFAHRKNGSPPSFSVQLGPSIPGVNGCHADEGEGGFAMASQDKRPTFEFGMQFSPSAHSKSDVDMNACACIISWSEAKKNVQRGVDGEIKAYQRSRTGQNYRRSKRKATSGVGQCEWPKHLSGPASPQHINAMRWTRCRQGPFLDCAREMPLPSAYIDLPNELWLETFRFLPRHELACVHSASRRFCALSHSLLFREFILDPDRHPAHGLDEFLERLALYTAPRIAPHVHTLSVSFQSGRPARTRTRTPLWSHSPLTEPLLNSLAAFSKLRILECAFRFNSEIHFSNLGLERLQPLEELRIEGGALYCATTPPPAKIRVTHFVYTAIPGLMLDARRPDASPWRHRSFLSMLDPGALRALTLAPSFDCSPGAWLRFDCDLYATFVHLRTVDIECDGPFLRDVHAFLAALPGLEDLTIRGEFRLMTDLAAAGEPACAPGPLSRSLSVYTGPCEYIPVFLPQTACTRLKITGACTAEDLCAALARTDCTRAVTDLALLLPLGMLRAWPRAAVHTLLAHFPRLARLRVTVSDDPNDDDDDPDAFAVDCVALEDLPDVLGAILGAPRGALECAVVEWDVSEATAAVLPDLQALRDALAYTDTSCAGGRNTLTVRSAGAALPISAWNGGSVWPYGIRANAEQDILSFYGQFGTRNRRLMGLPKRVSSLSAAAKSVRSG